MGGSARNGGLSGTPWDAPPSMAGADVARFPAGTEAMSRSLLTSVGRKGAAEEGAGPDRSQGWGMGVAQQPSSMGALSALMSAMAIAVRAGAYGDEMTETAGFVNGLTIPASLC